MERSRVAFTPGSIPTMKKSRRRFRCDCHLCDDTHHIEPEQRYVYNALPPRHPDIGNVGWWHFRARLDCCPIEYDPRPKEGEL